MKTLEIKRRLAIAKNVTFALTNIWKNKSISIKTKKRLLNTLVFPVALYGSECWILKKMDEKRIESFELYLGMVMGKRERGRPKTRLSDNIKEVCGLTMVEAERAAQERENWRKLVMRATEIRVTE
ncbi:uncharacterized protein [Penaeus vannamei]|uniref:uncharacterized protein n=1 Tax=Penaeus vannamei TaxID=6689 RepID=UPI00387F6D66